MRGATADPTSALARQTGVPPRKGDDVRSHAAGLQQVGAPKKSCLDNQFRGSMKVRPFTRVTELEGRF